MVMAVLVTILSSLLLASMASAHNSGHVILPDGTCINVGSENEGPLVPDANPNRNEIVGSSDYGKLDLIEGLGDQYGARYADTRGNSAVLPGPCPATP
jgi:hypothetical protein